MSKTSLIYFLFCLVSFQMQALEYEVQIDNESVTVSRVKIEPGELIGLHRDSLPQVVVALQGGTITRLEADGSETEVDFPTDAAVFRPSDPANVFHQSINRCNHPVELIVIQLKQVEN